MRYLEYSYNFTDDFAKMFPRDRETEEEEKSTELRLPCKNVTFAVTEQCNLRCTYCYQHNKRNVVMTKQTAKEAVDMLFRERDKEGRYLNSENSQAIIIEFIGGEPLLEIELMNYIMAYFLRKAAKLHHPWATNFMISVSTNGMLYNSPEVQKFIARYGKRCSFGITIDGNKELHDACRVTPDGKPSYDIVEKSMRSYLKIQPEANTKLTLAPENIEYLVPAIRNLYESIGLKHVFANVIFEEGWNDTYGKLFYKKLKELADWYIDSNLVNKFWCSLFDKSIGKPMKEEDNNNWCGGTGEMLAFTSDGNISPCIRYTDYNLNFKRPAVIIGNTKDGFESNEREVETVTMLKDITRRSQSTDECFNCPLASGCSWCSALHYELFGTPNKRATYICPMHKSRVLANIYFWNKLYLKYNFEDKYYFKNYIPDEISLIYIDQSELDMLRKLEEAAKNKANGMEFEHHGADSCHGHCDCGLDK